MVSQIRDGVHETRAERKDGVKRFDREDIMICPGRNPNRYAGSQGAVSNRAAGRRRRAEP